MSALVQAYNPTTKTVSTQTVQQVFINHDTDLIDVTLAVQPVKTQSKPQQVAVVSHGSHAPPVSTEVVHTTQKHPWLTINGWITAGQLHIGDQVQQLDGSTATVVGLKIIAGSASMYDLTVSNVHTFAVGDGQFVVHNCGSTVGDGPRDPVEILGNNPQGRENVRLYRAVGDEEYQRVQSEGFTPAPSRNEHKYFAPTIEEAQKFGEYWYGKENFGIVSGDFSYDDIVSGTTNPAQPDGFGTGVIHGGNIREVLIPNSSLGDFTRIVVHGFGMW